MTVMEFIRLERSKMTDRNRYRGSVTVWITLIENLPTVCRAQPSRMAVLLRYRPTEWAPKSKK